LRPTIDAALAEALATGRPAASWTGSARGIDAVRGQANIPFAMHAKGNALDQWVAAAARDADRAPVLGELRVGPGGLE